MLWGDPRVRDRVADPDRLPPPYFCRPPVPVRLLGGLPRPIDFEHFLLLLL
jgi:hypothetical protein